MRLILFFLFLIFSGVSIAQLPMNEQEFLARLKPDNPLPQSLLSTRTAVFYPYTMTHKELEIIQLSFQRSGIDAIAYFENDFLTAGRDVSMAMAQYLISREVTNICLASRKENLYSILFFEFNKKANFAELGQPAWTVQDRSLEEALRKIHRTASNGLKKENYLINDFPETGLAINPIHGQRNEFFAVDLKVDPLAVPKFGNPEMDKELEEIMKMYPYKYTLTEPNLSESELRKQGLLFVLRFVHTRDKIAKGTMGYDMTKSESGIVSITYPDSQPQLKNIHAHTEVYKFYFKHIDSGNVYLGNKWDADLTWQQALLNQLKGFRYELKIK